MKDVKKVVAEASRPNDGALHSVKFCLKQLYADREKIVKDEVAKDLTYEDLIGALLSARDAIEELEPIRKETQA